jgi:hypothetical protein
MGETLPALPLDLEEIGARAAELALFALPRDRARLPFRLGGLCAPVRACRAAGVAGGRDDGGRLPLGPRRQSQGRHPFPSNRGDYGGTPDRGTRVRWRPSRDRPRLGRDPPALSRVLAGIRRRYGSRQAANGEAACYY